MDITIIPPQSPSPAARAHSLSMIIKSFKGRKNVEVHLFRADWAPEEENEFDWNTLLGAPLDASSGDPEGSKRIVLEAFTDDERDQIVNYLKEQYSTRLTGITSAPLNFPVPVGLTGLTQVQGGKDAGFIEFLRIPSYSLDIPLKGYYDLSQHPPIAED